MSISGIGFSVNYTPRIDFSAARGVGRGNPRQPSPSLPQMPSQSTAETSGPASAARRGPVSAAVEAAGWRKNDVGEASESANSTDVAADTATDTTETGEDVQGLSEAEHKEVQKLEKRDAEVRAHEAAHLAAAGQYAAGGISLDYQRGPDGRQYAVGGDVSIDLSAESTPEATIAKMQTVRQAALAPASPSGQDRKVAAEATQKESTAQQKLSEEAGNRNESRSSGGTAARADADKTASENGMAREGTEKPSGLAAIENRSKIAGARSAYGGSLAGTGTLDWAM